VALPNLTPEQRQAALAKAAEARQARTQLLSDIKAGKQTIKAVLDRAKEDSVVGKTKVAPLVKALPGYGPAKVTGGAPGGRPGPAPARGTAVRTGLSTLRECAGRQGPACALTCGQALAAGPIGRSDTGSALDDR
jgi:hypothetical protein